ncbi:MAG: hypothetical protein ABS916_09045 [Carnobacterium sp.]|uniref:hypothetical protein n=1 Tax=Carnobacterium sp. TaxID=48221 RepID=UPI000551630B
MSIYRLQVVGIILLDIGCLLYLFIFLHDSPLSALGIKEWSSLVFILIFSVYATISTFKEITEE